MKSKVLGILAVFLLLGGFAIAIDNGDIEVDNVETDEDTGTLGAISSLNEEITIKPAIDPATINQVATEITEETLVGNIDWYKDGEISYPNECGLHQDCGLPVKDVDIESKPRIDCKNIVKVYGFKGCGYTEDGDLTYYLNRDKKIYQVILDTN